jgi:RNA polymerase sigma factor (TIGR02999 family)
MNEVTRVLNAMALGDDSGSAGLLDSIYGELRKMAAGKMAGERSGHTLQATALVHEAYLRLAGGEGNWASRGHFFGAASEAMRRILVENARRRAAAKRGGGQAATALDENLHGLPVPADDRLIQVHEVLDELEAEDPLKARIVKLRFFVGLGHDEIAALLGLNEKTVRRHWELAKVWLYRAIRDES